MPSIACCVYVATGPSHQVTTCTYNCLPSGISEYGFSNYKSLQLSILQLPSCLHSVVILLPPLTYYVLEFNSWLSPSWLSPSLIRPKDCPFTPNIPNASPWWPLAHPCDLNTSALSALHTDRGSFCKTTLTSLTPSGLYSEGICNNQLNTTSSAHLASCLSSLPSPADLTSTTQSLPGILILGANSISRN